MDILAKRLARAGLTVTATREPGGTSLGEAIRSIILTRENNKMVALSELSLFIACRAQLSTEVIEPALAAGNVVLSSRYRLSSLAYQGYGRGLDLALIERMNEIATSGRHPDLTFLLDLPACKALERRGKTSDRIEQEDMGFYQRVRTGYLELTQGDPNVHIINGMQPVDEIAQKVQQALML